MDSSVYLLQNALTSMLCDGSNGGCLSQNASKELIEVFEVDVDVSGRDRLYDYATCRYITRPDREAWRREHIHPHGGTPHGIPQDESKKMQVCFMDKALNDTRRNEDRYEKKPLGNPSSIYSIQNELIDTDVDTLEAPLNLPTRVLPIYKPGDVVRGCVKLQVQEAIQAKAVTLNFLGAGVVNIRSYQQHGHKDCTRYDYFANETRTLWLKTGKKPGCGEVFFSLESEAPQTGAVIPPGNHQWPFEFTIPQTTSQSTPNLHPNSDHYCYVTYRLKATIRWGKCCGLGDLVTHKGLWVEKNYDIASDPEKLLPITHEEVLDTGIIFKSGMISMKATLPRKAFKKGENIPLELIIDNQTSGKIDKVTAYIAMHGRFRKSQCQCKMMRRPNIDIRGAKKTMENVSSGMAPCANWELAWDFSGSSVDQNLMPTGTLDCKLIEVRYDVVVKVKRSRLCRNMELQIPIYIGDYNSKE